MAFVQKQNVSLSFNGGLNTKVDSLQLQPNNMLQLENARFTKDGQVSKRPGFMPLSRNVIDGSTINNAVAINTFNDELLLFDGNYLYTYLDEPDLWVNRGTAISVINSSQQIIRTITAEQINPDGVSLLGIDCYVWQDTRGGVRYSVLDSSMGSFVLQDQLIFNFPANLSQYLLRPKVLAVGSKIDIFYTDGGGTLFQNQVDPTRPAILSNPIRALTDGYVGDLIYDVANLSGSVVYAYNSTQYILVPPNNSIPSNQPVVRFPNGTAQSLYTGSGANCFGVTVDSQNTVWVTFAIPPGTPDVGLPWSVWVAAYSSTGVQILAPTIVAEPQEIVLTVTCVEGVDAGSLIVAYEVENSPDHYVGTVTVQRTGAYTTGPTQRGVGLASKAFKYGNNRFVNACSQSTGQSTYYTLCLNRNPLVAVGRINSQVGGGYRTNNMLAQCDNASEQAGGSGVDTSAFLVAFCKKGIFQSNNNTTFTLRGVSAETLDFAHPNAFNGMTFNNNFLFVGACLQNYDGVSVSEQNFHQFPENVTAAAQGGGGSMSAGLYQYAVTYEWTDNFGQTQYSAPSVPVSPTTISNDSVKLTGPMLRLTAKQNPRTPVSVCIYRTQVNLPVFYLVTTITNDPTTDTWSYTDTAADIGIAANKILYTASQVANSPPPSCSLMSYYQDRLVIGGLEDENLLWFSQSVFDLSNYSSIAPEFSNLFTMGVDSWKGGITALSWMDDKIIIYKDNTIYIQSGDGPNANGTGNDFPPAQSLLSTVGCSNQNSIAVTYGGVFFQSNKGIYQIDRGTNVSYIGAPVEDFNDLTITSAELLDQTDEVAFTTAEGTILVYNYFFSRWSIWQNAGYLQAVDSVMFRDNLAIVNAQGQVLVQNPEVFTDNGQYIPLKVQTPWLGWAGMQGYQSVFRCFLLGNLKGPHLLNVSIAYDYNPADTESFVINSNLASNVWGSLPVWGSNGPWGLNWTPYQFQINNSIHKCQSIRLTFEDSPASTYTEGYTLNSLTFEVGMLPDAARLPKGNKVAGSPV